MPSAIATFFGQTFNPFLKALERKIPKEASDHITPLIDPVLEKILKDGFVFKRVHVPGQPVDLYVKGKDDEDFVLYHREGKYEVLRYEPSRYKRR